MCTTVEIDWTLQSRTITPCLVGVIVLCSACNVSKEYPQLHKLNTSMTGVILLNINHENMYVVEYASENVCKKLHLFDCLLFNAAVDYISVIYVKTNMCTGGSPVIEIK